MKKIFTILFLMSSLLFATIPSTPTLVLPANNATELAISSYTFKWNTSTGTPTSYHIQISMVSTFAYYTVVDSAVADTFKVVTTLSANTKYFWRVRAKNGSGISAWSDVRSFTTITTLPIRPVLTAGNGTNERFFRIGLNAPYIAWNNTVHRYFVIDSTVIPHDTLWWSNTSVSGIDTAKIYINAMDYIPLAYRDSIRNYTCTTDVSSYLQTAINTSILQKKYLFAPSGGYPIGSTLFVYPYLFIATLPDNFNYTWAGNRKGGYRLSGVPGATRLIGKGDITILSVGDYDYATHGGTQDSVLAHRLDFIMVDGLYFQADSTVTPTKNAMEVRNCYLSRIYDLDFYHFKNGLVMMPGCTESDVAFVRGVGNLTSSESFVKVVGDSRVGAAPNNTVSTYNNIQVRGYTKAGVYFTGDEFGDAIISNVIGYGNTGSTAGVWLQSTGSHTYSSKIGVYGVDIDGVSNAAVRVDTCSIIKIANVNANIGAGKPKVIWNLAGTPTYNQCYFLDSLAINKVDTTKSYHWLNNQWIKKWLTVQYDSTNTGTTLLGSQLAMNMGFDGVNYRMLKTGYPYLNYLDPANGNVYFYTGHYRSVNGIASFGSQAAITLDTLNNASIHGNWTFADNLYLNGTSKKLYFGSSHYLQLPGFNDGATAGEISFDAMGDYIEYVGNSSVMQRLSVKSDTTGLAGRATRNWVTNTFVKTPATNHDGYIPLWYGANSKTLSDGLPYTSLATASTVVARNGSGNSYFVNTYNSQGSYVGTQSTSTGFVLFYDAGSSFYTYLSGASVLTGNNTLYLPQANGATLLSTGGSYSNPSWITGLAWSKISSTPTTLAGYGILDGASLTADQTFTGMNKWGGVQLDTATVTATVISTKYQVSSISSTKKSWLKLTGSYGAGTQLIYIGGGVIGRVITLSNTQGSPILVKHLTNDSAVTGNIRTNGTVDRTLNQTNSFIVLMYDGTNWQEQSYSNNQ